MATECERRDFLQRMVKFPCTLLLLSVCGPLESLAETLGQAAGSPPVTGTETGGAKAPTETPTPRSYGMGIQVDKCIGCGRCVEACKAENDVLREPYYFRTWVERYVFDSNGNVTVDCPEGGIRGFGPLDEKADVFRSFFVPKLCNHCKNPPCVQVCPVGATFTTQDGVVLVDKDYCIGCRYCIQACPYGARYLDPRTKTADKCTFCYHRLQRGLRPACVEACPTQARIFGEVDVKTSPLTRLKRMQHVQILKPHLNTEPQVFYTGIDTEVR